MLKLHLSHMLLSLQFSSRLRTEPQLSEVDRFHQPRSSWSKHLRGTHALVSAPTLQQFKDSYD